MPGDRHDTSIRGARHYLRKLSSSAITSNERGGQEQKSGKFRLRPTKGQRPISDAPNVFQNVASKHLAERLRWIA